MIFRIYPEFFEVKRKTKKFQSFLEYSRASCYISDAIEQITFFTLNKRIKIWLLVLVTIRKKLRLLI